MRMWTHFSLDCALEEAHLRLNSPPLKTTFTSNCAHSTTNKFMYWIRIWGRRKNWIQCHQCHQVSSFTILSLELWAQVSSFPRHGFGHAYLRCPTGITEMPGGAVSLVYMFFFYNIVFRPEYPRSQDMDLAWPISDAQLGSLSCLGSRRKEYWGRKTNFFRFGQNKYIFIKDLKI